MGHNQSYGALVIFGFSVEVVPYFSIFILYIYIYIYIKYILVFIYIY